MKLLLVASAILAIAFLLTYVFGFRLGVGKPDRGQNDDEFSIDCNATAPPGAQYSFHCD